MTTTELSNQQALVFPDSVRFADIVIIERVAADPLPDSVNAGRIFFNFVTKEFKGDDGSAIQVFGQGASGSTIHNLVSGTHFDTAGVPTNLSLLRYLAGTAKWTTFSPGGANQVLGLHGALADFEYKTIQGDNVNTFITHTPGIINIASYVRNEFSISGLVGSSSDGLTYVFDARSAVLIDTNYLSFITQFTPSMINNISFSGVNGRDQAAVFPPYSDVHIWLIWNGVSFYTLSTLNNPSIPPAVAATSYFTYVTSFRLNDSGTIIPFRTVEKWNYFYNLQQVHTGSNIIETVTSLFNIPLNSIAAQLFFNHFIVSGSAGESSSLNIKIVSNNIFHAHLVVVVRNEYDSESLVMPILNREFVYQIVNAGAATSGVDFFVQGWQVRAK